MNPHVKWHWTKERDYRRTMARLRRCKRSRVLALPSNPEAPMVGILSGLFIEALDDQASTLHLNRNHRDEVFISEAQKFLRRYEGVDLDDTVLVDRTIFPTQGGLGWGLDEPVVMFWMQGTIGASSPIEWDIDDDYYADLWLLRTELNHGCTLEE